MSLNSKKVFGLEITSCESSFRNTSPTNVLNFVQNAQWNLKRYSMGKIN